MTELLKVQEAALEVGWGKFGFAYFLEMGMGMTLLALTEFQRYVQKKEVTRLVVVCPNTFKGGWQREVLKHDMNIDPHIYVSGGDNKKFLNKKFDKPPMLIVNYEAIRSDTVKKSIQRFVENRSAMIVFDESIQLKNNKAAQTKSCIELSRSFKYKRVMSGRPTTQGPHDLWGQLRAIGKADGWNFYVWRNTFCKMGGFQFKKVTGLQNGDILETILKPVSFRAKKEDWLDLPPKVYTIRDYKMSREQQNQFLSMERDFLLWLNSDENVSVDAAITKYIKLAQIQVGFIIDESQRVHELVEDANNPRLAALLDILENEVTGKAIISYHHKHVYKILSRALRDYAPATIQGGMTPEQIAEETNQFNNNPDCRIMLLQLTAGRYGHTLLGGENPRDKCKTTVFFENSYSLDTRSQVEDRNHRIGQTSNSVIYVDFVGTSLDRRVIEALQMKTSIADAIMGRTNVPA
jgi:SNF2 family DNA or RNA helicase